MLPLHCRLTSTVRTLICAPQRTPTSFYAVYFNTHGPGCLRPCVEHPPRHSAMLCLCISFLHSSAYSPALSRHPCLGISFAPSHALSLHSCLGSSSAYSPVLSLHQCLGQASAHTPAVPPPHLTLSLPLQVHHSHVNNGAQVGPPVQHLHKVGGLCWIMRLRVQSDQLAVAKLGALQEWKWQVSKAARCWACIPGQRLSQWGTCKSG